MSHHLLETHLFRGGTRGQVTRPAIYWNPICSAAAKETGFVPYHLKKVTAPFCFADKLLRGYMKYFPVHVQFLRNRNRGCGPATGFRRSVFGFRRSVFGFRGSITSFSDKPAVFRGARSNPFSAVKTAIIA